jgi:hypothetical protein
MLKRRLMKVLIILSLGTLVLAACGGGNVPDGTPTLGVDQIQTYAVSTFSSALTLTAIAAPTDTPAPSLTPAPTIPVLATSTGGNPFGAAGTPGVPVTSGGSTTSCYGLTFVSDVTIPDNTQMDPGETFTKTWKVQNSGSCAWEAGSKFQNTGGVGMGASTLTLPSSVASGATFDLSVPMTAPGTSGTARSNWRMSTATGQFFGDEVYVQIVVGGAAAATNTTAPTTAP